MITTPTIAEQLLHLKSTRNAIILAHHYQEEEIQELADHVGDTLELAAFAKDSAAEVIAFCGARFMAETTKILNPHRIVLLPDLHAGCSLVDSCPAEGVRAFKRRNPDHVVVSYLNTSAEVKAESDILCTARNAVAIVNSIPASQPLLFLPDINLGNYVKKQTGRANMRLWQGACILHATFPARRLLSARRQHPAAPVAAHPECPADVLRSADFVGSLSAITDWCCNHSAEEFILVTGSAIRYSLEKHAPGKRFYFIANENCNCSDCPYMKSNSIDKLLACLLNLHPRIDLPPEIIQRARLPLARMLAVN